MRLELMNINEFIAKNKILEVKNSRVEGKGGRLDPEGLYSEEIFGRMGHTNRKKTFGYINLHTKVIHPEIFSIVAGLSPVIASCLRGKKKFFLNQDGVLEESPDGAYGISGVKEFIDIYDKIDLKKTAQKTHPDSVKFLTKNRELIFIDKLLCLPAGVRDIQQSKMTNKILVTSSEINTMYEDLLRSTSMVDENTLEFLDAETIKNIVYSIQKKCCDINEWIRSRLKGKGGILRSGLLRKTIDYSGGFNITGDPTVPLGYVKLPLPAVLKFYEPFTIYQILKNPFNEDLKRLIQEFLNIDTLTEQDIKKFLTAINDQHEILTPELRDELYRLAQDIVEDKYIINKRDPCENRMSYAASKILIDKNSYVAAISPIDTARINGDFDGDTMVFFPLFTKEANEEAKKKLSPLNTKTMYPNPSWTNQQIYQLTLDAAATVYTLTKS